MTIIREIREDDAESFLWLCNQLDHESSFMMLEPGERKTNVEEQRQLINDILAGDHGVIFVAEEAVKLVGHLSAVRETYARNKHTANVVIGILENFTGQGIGSALFEALEGWAKRKGLHRLELSVMTHNPRGIALYQKMGFEMEGIKRHSLLVDGSYVDEYYMSKLM